MPTAGVSQSILTPATCRYLSGPAPRTGDFMDPLKMCVPSYPIAPDPHCAVKSRTGAGIISLLRSLRGRRLVFIGDSISGQVANALECAIRRDDSAGEILPATRVAEAPELASACGRVWEAVQQGELQQKEFEDSMCRALGAGTFASRARLQNATFLTLHGNHVPRYNVTFFRKFGDVYQFARPLRRGGKRAGGSRGASAQSPLDELLRLPNHVELVRTLDLADAIVLNFGLHYGDSDAYRMGMRQALEELEVFGREAGKAAVFRETSSQHFPAPSGDYHDAIRRDPSLVLAAAPTTTTPRARSAGARARTSQQQTLEWTGPSMCARIAPDAPQHWRNRVITELLRDGRYTHVQLQPFEEMSRSRWDYHASTKHVVGGGWKSDCTHWCYSPCFWAEVLHGMQQALKAGRVAHR